MKTSYNKIVNYDKETREITVLDYIFIHEDWFKGATGTKFEPISKSYHKEATTVKAIEEHLRDAVNENEIPDEYLYSNNEERLIKNPYLKWAKEIKSCGEQNRLIFDTSYSELWDYIRQELNLTEKEAYMFNCIGGGRCFDKDFRGNINVELSELIREVESK